LELLRDFRRLAEDAFLEGYVEGRGEPLTANEKCLIDAFTIEKAAYEIAYEIANRPDWVDVPLRGLAFPLEHIPAKEPAHG
jgi:maltose alpha-D-glucosyltransferase/alpha-amylase